MGNHPDLFDVRCTSVVLCAIAVVVTILRLYFRTKVRMWWWDDSFALFASVSSAFVVIGTFNVAEDNLAPPEVYYLIALGYYLPIWSARLSILFTIIRFAPRAAQRRALGYLAGIVILQCLFLLTEAAWWYETDGRRYYEDRNYVGEQPLALSVSQISTTMITDILLVLAPILILRSTRLDPRLHRRLVAAVSISVLATVFSVIHIVLVLTVSGLWGGLSALVEIFVSLLVCNTYVMVLSIMLRAAKYNRSATTDGIYISTVILEEHDLQGPAWIEMDGSSEENSPTKMKIKKYNVS